MYSNKLPPTELYLNMIQIITKQSMEKIDIHILTDKGTLDRKSIEPK